MPASQPRCLRRAFALSMIHLVPYPTNVARLCFCFPNAAEMGKTEAGASYVRRKLRHPKRRRQSRGRPSAMAKKKKQAKSAAKAIKPPKASPSVAPEVKAAAKPAEKPKAAEKTKTPAPRHPPSRLKCPRPNPPSLRPRLESLREQGRSGKIFGLESCQHRECAGTEGRSGEGFCSGAQGQSVCESRGRTDRKACHRQASRGQACLGPLPRRRRPSLPRLRSPRAPARPRRRR